MTLAQDKSVIRAPFLDLFRIILCLGVVVYHYIPNRPSSGPFMVLGFFVMSGFLLGLYFDRLNQFDVETFYRKKALRLLPMFITTVILGFLLRSVGEVIFTGQLSLLPDFSTTEWAHCNPARLITHYNTPTWFMIVVLNMLICAPLLYVLYHKKAGLDILLIAGLLVSLLLYAQLPAKPTLFADNLYYLTLYRAYQFIAGIYAAKIFCHLYRKVKTEKYRAIKNALTVFLFSLFIIISTLLIICKQEKDLHFFNYSIQFDIISVAFFCGLIPLLYSSRITLRDSTASCINYMAALTYPMYLVHVITYKPVYLLAEKYADSLPGWIPPVSAFILSAGISAILLHAQNKYFRIKP